MIWQDLVFAVGGVSFIVALLPSVFGSWKPDPRTCFITGAWLWVFAVCYLTLDLVFAGITTAGSASLWTVLYAQSRKGRA